jgi:hypothetical protein
MLNKSGAGAAAIADGGPAQNMLNEGNSTKTTLAAKTTSHAFDKLIEPRYFYPLLVAFIVFFIAFAWQMIVLHT